MGTDRPVWGGHLPTISTHQWRVQFRGQASGTRAASRHPHSPHNARGSFRKFLDSERNVPAGLDVHVVMDNASRHKTKLIRNWFAGGRTGIGTPSTPPRSARPPNHSHSRLSPRPALHSPAGSRRGRVSPSKPAAHPYLAATPLRGRLIAGHSGISRGRL
jgi:hypothetical protein